MARDLENRVDLVLKKGTTFDVAFVEHHDGNDDPITLVGATATANFYAGTPEVPGSLAYEVTTANGRFVITSSGDAETHRAAFALTPAQVAAAAATGAVWYEYLLTESGGRVSEVAWGNLTFLPTGASP